MEIQGGCLKQEVLATSAKLLISKWYWGQFLCFFVVGEVNASMERNAVLMWRPSHTCINVRSSLGNYCQCLCSHRTVSRPKSDWSHFGLPTHSVDRMNALSVSVRHVDFLHSADIDRYFQGLQGTSRYRRFSRARSFHWKRKCGDNNEKTTGYTMILSCFRKNIWFPVAILEKKLEVSDKLFSHFVA